MTQQEFPFPYDRIEPPAAPNVWPIASIIGALIVILVIAIFLR